MLEACRTQGAGLHALALQQPAPRVIAMASHGDRHSELPLLCSLCAIWAELDYPVAVLDATMAESASTPGLQQLMDHPGSRIGASESNLASWPIIPAAKGLARLFRDAQGNGGSRSRLQQLSRLLRDYEIIVLYVGAQDLATYLADSGMAPLLAVSAKRASLLGAYQSLKQLLINGRLEPTIVAVMDESDQSSLALGFGMCKSLQDCALAYLDHAVTPLPVCVPQHDGLPAHDDMNRLALRLLEGAYSLAPSTPSMTTHTDHRLYGGDHLTRSF